MALVTSIEVPSKDAQGLKPPGNFDGIDAGLKASSTQSELLIAGC